MFSCEVLKCRHPVVLLVSLKERQDVYSFGACNRTLVEQTIEMTFGGLDIFDCKDVIVS